MKTKIHEWCNEWYSTCEIDNKIPHPATHHTHKRAPLTLHTFIQIQLVVLRTYSAWHIFIHSISLSSAHRGVVLLFFKRRWRQRAEAHRHQSPSLHIIMYAHFSKRNHQQHPCSKRGKRMLSFAVCSLPHARGIRTLDLLWFVLFSELRVSTAASITPTVTLARTL